MIPISFPEANTIMRRPNGLEPDQCYDIPAYKGPDGAGCPVVMTLWKFSKEDLEEILRTGELWVAVAGHSMPPIWMSTEYPWEPGIGT
jgi:hypothetical protein